MSRIILVSGEKKKPREKVQVFLKFILADNILFFCFLIFPSRVLC